MAVGLVGDHLNICFIEAAEQEVPAGRKVLGVDGDFGEEDVAVDVGQDEIEFLLSGYVGDGTLEELDVGAVVEGKIFSGCFLRATRRYRRPEFQQRRVGGP